MGFISGRDVRGILTSPRCTWWLYRTLLRALPGLRAFLNSQNVLPERSNPEIHQRNEQQPGLFLTSPGPQSTRMPWYLPTSHSFLHGSLSIFHLNHKRLRGLAWVDMVYYSPAGDINAVLVILHPCGSAEREMWRYEPHAACRTPHATRRRVNSAVAAQRR